MWICCLIFFMVVLVLAVLCSHYTTPVGVVFLVPSLVGTLAYGFIHKDGWLVFVAQCLISIVIVVSYFVLKLHIDMDFSRMVVSMTSIPNSVMVPSMKDGTMVLGRVMPFNSRQLLYNRKCIAVNEVASAAHTIISGSSGSGKTYGLMSLVRQNICEAGRSVIFVEYKGDPKVVEEVKKTALSHGYDTYTLSNGLSDFNYDPLKSLNNVGRIEAIMNMRKWSLDGSDAHYKTATQLLLQTTIGKWGHEWEANSEKYGSYTLGYREWMKRYMYSSSEKDAYITVTKLLEILITSSLEPMFCFRNERELNFSEWKNGKHCLIVSFTSSNKDLATSFSSLLFKDLLDECTVDPPGSNIYLYVDESGTLENPYIVKDILEKGRSGKIAATLSMQDINQIVIQTNEAYLNSILGTVSNFVVYSGATRTTAEKLAGVQLADIEPVLMNLKKPINGQKPTAIYISKYPTLNRRRTSEVYRFVPWIYDERRSQDQEGEGTSPQWGSWQKVEHHGDVGESLDSYKNDLEPDVEEKDDTSSWEELI